MTRKSSANYIHGSFERVFIVYNVAVALAFAALLIYLTAQRAGYVQLLASSSQPTITGEQGATNEPESATDPSESADATTEAPATATDGESQRPSDALDVLAPTLLIMFMAGGTGGTLCNLRGIFRYYRDEGGFPLKFAVPFFIRPGMGAIVGLATFFVASLANAALADASSLTWASFPGRFAYIGLAVLAGFASQEFMERLKEVAKTTFGEEAKELTAVETELIGHWTDGKARPKELKPAAAGELVLLYGTPENGGDGGFRWSLSGPDKKICVPEGDITAIKISGGADSERQMFAEQIVRLVSLEAADGNLSDRQDLDWCK